MHHVRIPVEVEAYAGYKGEESPRRFRLRGQWYEVAAIEDRWYQGSVDPQAPVSDYFRVREADGTMRVLEHDRESDSWALVERVRDDR
jgi:lipocalin